MAAMVGASNVRVLWYRVYHVLPLFFYWCLHLVCSDVPIFEYLVGSVCLLLVASAFMAIFAVLRARLGVIIVLVFHLFGLLCLGVTLGLLVETERDSDTCEETAPYMFNLARFMAVSGGVSTVYVLLTYVIAIFGPLTRCFSFKTLSGWGSTIVVAFPCLTPVRTDSQRHNYADVLGAEEATQRLF